MGQYFQGDLNTINLLEEFSTKEEIANIFDVSVRTVERWVRLRKIPSPVRIGNTSLFHLPTLRKSLLAMNSQPVSGRR